VARDADGWTADFRILFSQVRFNPNESILFSLRCAPDRRRTRLVVWSLLA
jgi:hypothetical protein